MRPCRLAALCVITSSCFFLWGAANCTNSAPVVANDSAGNSGLLVYVDVLANDTEPDGELMTLLPATWRSTFMTNKTV